MKLRVWDDALEKAMAHHDLCHFIWEDFASRSFSTLPIELIPIEMNTLLANKRSCTTHALWVCFAPL
jgi:hypothetical protein